MKPLKESQSLQKPRRSGEKWHNREHWKETGWSPEWHQKKRFLRTRFIGFLSIIALLVSGGIAILAFMFTHFLGGTGETAMLVWVAGCSLSLTLPLLAIAMAVRTFRSIATPLADIMTAADAVARGDLAVRVPDSGSPEFRQLARSFNHMIAELDRSDQQRRNLTADVAHELRTPLHIIQGNLEGILDQVYQPTPEHIEATLEETRLLARLVDDLRTLSLAEAGQLPLKQKRVDVAELLADIQTSFSGQAHKLGVFLQIEVAETKMPLTFIGDAHRLNQILTNLVTNALRHTTVNDTILLKAAATATDITMTISDTGQGIPEQELPFIFDRFWRGDRARSHAEGVGGGLGLAIVRQLVQAHNGHITVASQVDSGTTFTITLPKALSDHVDSSRQKNVNH